MSTRDLIDAIEAGEATNIEASFNDIMATKVSERLDAMRDDMAQNMFKDPEVDSSDSTIEDEPEEETVGE